MKRQYLKPICEMISATTENYLMSGSRIPDGEQVNPAGSGDLEFTEEADGGEEADAKLHHNWNIWDE